MNKFAQRARKIDDLKDITAGLAELLFSKRHNVILKLMWVKFHTAKEIHHYQENAYRRHAYDAMKFASFVKTSAETLKGQVDREQWQQLWRFVCALECACDEALKD